jgi:hypothetical protein
LVTIVRFVLKAVPASGRLNAVASANRRRALAEGTSMQKGKTMKRWLVCSLTCGLVATGIAAAPASATPLDTGAHTVAVATKAVAKVSVTVTGKAKVNATLTAKASTATKGATFKYQWLADGAVINKATGKTYKPKVKDLGKKISVTVTATKKGSTKKAATSTKTAKVTLTSKQAEIRDAAEDAVEIMPMSRELMIASMKFATGYSDADVKAGIDAAKLNWNKQAVECVKFTFDGEAYTRQDAIELLTGFKFTRAQVNYALGQLGL